MRPQLILAAAFPLQACAPCHDWDEIVLLDKAGRDEGEALATVQASIDTFVDWTQRDCTRIDKVKVVEEARAGGQRVSGYYRPLLRNIVVGHKDETWRMHHTTLHELCHAVDHEEGMVSLEHAEALEPYTAEPSENSYANADERTLEAFAKICAQGPTLHPLWRQIEEHCGGDYLDEAYQAVHEVMFSARDRSAALGSFDGSYEAWELAGIDPSEESEGLDWGTLVSGAEGLFMMDTLYALDEDGAWLGYQPVLRHVDPSGARVLDSLALEPFPEALGDATGNPTTAPWALLGSTAQPLLYDRFAPGTAYLVHSDPLELEAVAFPTLVEGARIRGFERDGRLLALIDEGDGAGLASAAGDDGAWNVPSWESEVLDDEPIQAFEIGEQGVLLYFSGESGPELTSLDFDGGINWSTPLGLGDGRTDTIGVHRLADGTALTTTFIPASGDSYKLFPMRYDPDNDNLSAPSSDCNTLRYYLDGVSWGGDYWMVYRPEREDGSSGALTLLRLDIEPG